ncbi:MAG: hypothetical protein HN390_04695 [Anaerolineae bacterium]|jgi:hypothetical protein|nr:hypothetical protein [Anaerolineae bacterium]MBT7190835.1 hypothetical protein [Anaerolineae bacterium]MBT7991594.1 hypothetical protein [Anaerolineae bacterium]
MNKKTLILTLAMIFTLVATTAFAPQTAYAQSGGGSGTLKANGDGLAGIRGSGDVSISGSGILWIRDHAGDAVINVSGGRNRREGENGWVRYSGFNGEASVSGSQITVALSGFGIDLEATGTGKFVLRGSGSYTVEKDGITVLNGVWTEEAQVFSIP